MSAGADEKDDKAERAAIGVRQLAVAVLASPATSAEERALAQAVLGNLEAAIIAGGIDGPGEAASVAAVFNRQLDVVLDAANRSHGARERMTRRTHMARALEAGGVVLIEQAELARLVTFKLEREAAKVISFENCRTIEFGPDDDTESLGAELLEQDPNVND